MTEYDKIMAANSIELREENWKLKERIIELERKEKVFNKCKDLFNKWMMTNKDEFLQELIPLMQD